MFLLRPLRWIYFILTTGEHGLFKLINLSKIWIT